MQIPDYIFLAAGAAVCLFFALFAVDSIRERKPRASAVSAALVVAFGILWFGGSALLHLQGWLLYLPPMLLLMFAVFFYAPIGEGRSIRIEASNERVDERDVIFAREEYHPGTEKYEIYYSMRPELKEIDDRMRGLPELLEPGGRYFDPVRSSFSSAIFDIIRSLGVSVDGEVHAARIEVDPGEMTQAIKGHALCLGADDVGVANLNPAYIYTNVGRGPEPWGSPIVNDHRFVIVFDVEMNYDTVEQAPYLPITEESATKYLHVAMISISLARYIRRMGYPARAHIAGSNYQIMLPPVAYEAGLGELGRLGYLISPRFGPRIRLGAVTTDLPLIPDKPIEFGVQDFCEKCFKCAIQCPSGSIPGTARGSVRGVEKWQLDIESCMHYWRKIGTDCGLCMRVCPFSHPRSLVHKLIRKGIRKSSFARWISVHGDNVFYGKRIRP